MAINDLDVKKGRRDGLNSNYGLDLRYTIILRVKL